MALREKVNSVIETFSLITLVKEAKVYNVYVLFLMLFAYLLNQLDRYILAIVNLPLSQDLQYGDKGCLVNSSLSKKDLGNITCKDVHPEAACLNNSLDACEWNYNGQGSEYQLLTGPIFILIYTFMGVVVGFAADRYNPVILLAVSLFFWSAMTLLSGFVTEYWQLALLRFGLGLGEAGCTPFASSLISQYFAAELRGSALSVYNWGIYTGYSLSYAIGNSVMTTLGWRWAFYISGGPGLLLAVIIFLSVKEPAREELHKKTHYSDHSANNDITGGKPWLLEQFKPYKVLLRPSALVLVLAGSIRNAGGYTWAYNTQPYFISIGETPDEILQYMSWIPLVGGSLGVVVGGLISDKIVKRRGTYARVWVLIISQVLASPFAAGALFLSPPYCYISLIPANIIGEMWVGVLLTIVIELFPTNIRTSAVAIYLFIITNIGGNIQLLIPYIKRSFINLGYSDTQAFRGALYILYPGLYILSSALFLISMLALRRDLTNTQRLNEELQRGALYSSTESATTGGDDGDVSDTSQLLQSGGDGSESEQLLDSNNYRSTSAVNA